MSKRSIAATSVGFGCAYGVVGVVWGIYLLQHTPGENYFRGASLIAPVILLVPIGLIVGAVLGAILRYRDNRESDQRPRRDRPVPRR